MVKVTQSCINLPLAILEALHSFSVSAQEEIFPLILALRGWKAGCCGLSVARLGDFSPFWRHFRADGNFFFASLFSKWQFS
jgi:hypothetical protein